MVIVSLVAACVIVAPPAAAGPGRGQARLATVPPAPVFLQSSGVNHGAFLEWQAQGSGGPPITGYTLTPYVDGTPLAPIAVDSQLTTVGVVVSALVNGDVYRFTVAAKNAVGTGPQSALSGRAIPPFASLASFVSQQYADFVGRPADGAEQQAGVAQLNADAVPGSFALHLRRSHENAAHVDPVTRLYFAFFLRIPDAGGLRYWVGRDRSGTSLTAVSDQFATSAEFVHRYGSLTNRQFVDLVYQNVLGRPADQAGSDYWTGQLDTHARTRGNVMAGFSESPENVTKRAPSVDVAVTWIDMLTVSPSQAAFNDWVTKLTSGGETVADLAAALFPSASYAARF